MSTPSPQDPEPVIAYIDGFNLYFGLNEKGWRRYLWLDVPAMARRLLRANQKLVGVKYFTTRINSPAESVRRQTLFLDALEARGGLEIIFGNFIYSQDGCDTCGAKWTKREEKQTDVNIALHMLRDAYGEYFKTALLISGDSDLVPVVKEIEGACPGRHVLVVWPPLRKSDELCGAAARSFALGKKHLQESQLPMTVPGRNGYALCQPAEWWGEETENS